MKAVRIANKASRSALMQIRYSSKIPKFITQSELETDDWLVFPREKEGNIYSDNWSLVEHGVTSTENGYKNSRIPLLLSKVQKKVVNNKVEENISYSGSYDIKEAGDTLTHEFFEDLLKEHQEYFSHTLDLYFEDAGVVGTNSARVGIRVLTTNPAVALMMKSFLFPQPPRETNRSARFDNWKLNSTVKELTTRWNGKHYYKLDQPENGGKGERPIVVYHGGPGKDVAVQFVEISGSIVGANLIVGSEAPLRSLIDVIGFSSSVLINEQQANGLAVPSLVLVKGKNTVVVVGADDDILEEAAAAGDGNLVFGAYSNYLTAEGVSSLFHGAVVKASAPVKQYYSDLPAVSFEGKAMVQIAPNNMAFPAAKIIFYEKGSSAAALSSESALQRLVALTDEKKTDVTKALIGNVELSVAGNFADILSAL